MPRLLHTMIRVGDLQRSIDFYTQRLGMKLLRTWDMKEDEFTLAFLGYGTELESTVLELTYNYGQTSYEHGGAYGHIAIGVEDVKATMAELKKHNVPVDYEDDEGFMAFIVDPDGYYIELLNEKMMCDKAAKQMKEQGTA
ncbi:lactoylglutathione lyase [Strigomonas culicis]|uniref:lactoylglutathione lyase n=1 Tax=Strigomonas culicis TaxID=28005 RepID=S9UR82_9TRYP|nr:lactoylglutathione lyase [Strigomonas culicis]|eukprot:EPY31304.1 lactoylglutathione lyase [Strigomonas culicis]